MTVSMRFLKAVTNSLEIFGKLNGVDIFCQRKLNNHFRTPTLGYTDTHSPSQVDLNIDRQYIEFLVVVNRV